ncbi:MAG: FAD-dependent oxidoreductase, partial [Thermodesulfobacteriota bacterium]|nr:FAD-dependent oxidoreductase [Thermodesulfobacteriota bacterium]
AGPSGLAAAGWLACQGCEVQVFDKMPKPGGLLVFGIPDFRIPIKRSEDAAKLLEDRYGVVFHGRTKVCGPERGPGDEGDEFSENRVELSTLREQFDALILCTGSWRSRKMNVPGEDLPGVYSGLEYLFAIRAQAQGKTKIQAPETRGKNVVVIGSGLCAVDAAQSALKNGAAKVSMLYRRTINESPAGSHEIMHLRDQGVFWQELSAPVCIVGDGRVQGISCLQCALGEPDASGRCRPVPQEGTESELAADMVISAVGEVPTLPNIKELKLEEVRKGVSAWPQMTGIENVFVAGDALTGPGKIGLALVGGLNAARSLMKRLEQKVKT